MTGSLVVTTMIIVVVASAGVHDAPYPSTLVIRDVERAVGPDGDADWPVLRGGWQWATRAGKAIGEGLGGARRVTMTCHRLEHHLEAFVGKRRAIEAAVEGDEDAVAIATRELLAVVECHAVGRPV